MVSNGLELVHNPGSWLTGTYCSSLLSSDYIHHTACPVPIPDTGMDVLLSIDDAVVLEQIRSLGLCEPLQWNMNRPALAICCFSIPPLVEVVTARPQSDVLLVPIHVIPVYTFHAEGADIKTVLAVVTPVTVLIAFLIGIEGTSCFVLVRTHACPVVKLRMDSNLLALCKVSQGPKEGHREPCDICRIALPWVHPAAICKHHVEFRG